MGIVRITESMKRDPKVVILGSKRIGKYEVEISRAKAWFHKFADWEIQIKEKDKVLVSSSHSEQDTNPHKAVENLKKIQSIADIKNLIKSPWILYK